MTLDVAKLRQANKKLVSEGYIKQKTMGTDYFYI